MKIDVVTVGQFAVNCLILWSSASRKAIVIDPGAEPDRIVEALERKKLTVAAYLLTHGHIDHISGLAALHRRDPAPVSLHAEDQSWAFDPANCMEPFYGPPEPPPAVMRQIREGEEWTDGEIPYRVIETPGHTPGSVCFFFPNLKTLVSGDTLFAGSVGRTDLQGGNTRTLAASLRKLTALPDDTRVFPGHGPATAIGREKKHNFFLRMPEAKAV